jgi:predicted DNA-binding transcriptional regulator YafY
MVGTVLDWFGNAAIIKEDGDGIKVTVNVIEDAMLYWALQFGKRVEVLTPKKLRDKIREAVQGMWGKYK